MHQSPSWEANMSSATQEILRILWNPKVSSPHSQQPATCPYPEPDRSSLCHPISKIHFNIIARWVLSSFSQAPYSLAVTSSYLVFFLDFVDSTSKIRDIWTVVSFEMRSLQTTWTSYYSSHWLKICFYLWLFDTFSVCRETHFRCLSSERLEYSSVGRSVRRCSESSCCWCLCFTKRTFLRWHWSERSYSSNRMPISSGVLRFLFWHSERAITMIIPDRNYELPKHHTYVLNFLLFVSVI
jgi:hypothetical protein